MEDRGAGVDGRDCGHGLTGGGADDRRGCVADGRHQVLCRGETMVVPHPLRALESLGQDTRGHVAVVLAEVRPHVDALQVLLVAYPFQLRSTVCPVFDYLEGDAMAWRGATTMLR